jgi:hypothetical protein
MENPSIPEIQNKFLQYPLLLSSKKEVMKTRESARSDYSEPTVQIGTGLIDAAQVGAAALVAASPDAQLDVLYYPYQQP